MVGCFSTKLLVSLHSCIMWTWLRPEKGSDCYQLQTLWCLTVVGTALLCLSRNATCESRLCWLEHIILLWKQCVDVFGKWTFICLGDSGLLCQIPWMLATENCNGCAWCHSSNQLLSWKATVTAFKFVTLELNLRGLLCDRSNGSFHFPWNVAKSTVADGEP